MAMRRTAVADTVREVGIYGICMTNGQAGGLEVGRVWWERTDGWIGGRKERENLWILVDWLLSSSGMNC